MLLSDIYFVTPNKFNSISTKNILKIPLLAPFISALLNDICEDIHIAKNKKTMNLIFMKLSTVNINFISDLNVKTKLIKFISFILLSIVILNSLYILGIRKYIKISIENIPPKIGAIPIKKFPIC